MVEVIHSSEPIARKDYPCEASYFIREGGTLDYMTFSEKRVFARAKSQAFKIIKGQKYMRQFNKYEGDTYTFRAIPEVHSICAKYDLYPE